jgi:hypothetical protein
VVNLSGQPSARLSPEPEGFKDRQPGVEWSPAHAGRNDAPGKPRHWVRFQDMGDVSFSAHGWQRRRRKPPRPRRRIWRRSNEPSTHFGWSTTRSVRTKRSVARRRRKSMCPRRETFPSVCQSYITRRIGRRGRCAPQGKSNGKDKASTSPRHWLENGSDLNRWRTAFGWRISPHNRWVYLTNVVDALNRCVAALTARGRGRQRQRWRAAFGPTLRFGPKPPLQRTSLGSVTTLMKTMRHQCPDNKL